MIEKLFLSPEDLDEMLKLFQNLLDQPPNDMLFDKISQTERKLANKYRNYQLDESDRKLLNRFLSRIYDLIEISKQKINQDVRSKMIESLKQFNESKHLQFQKFFSAVVTKKQSEETQTNKMEAMINLSYERESQKKSLPSWYEISLANKPLHNFYQNLFWKLYDNEILQLDKQYISTLFILYQTREQNYDRLYRDIKNRNLPISQSLQWVKHHQMEAINFEQRAKSLSCHLDTKLNHTCTMDYGQKAVTFFVMSQRKSRVYSQIPQSIIKKKAHIIRSGYSPQQSSQICDDEGDFSMIQIEPVRAHISGIQDPESKIDFRGGNTSIILLEKNPTIQMENDKGNFSPQKNRKYRRNSFVKQAMIMNFPEIKQPSSLFNNSVRSRKSQNENVLGADKQFKETFNLKQLIPKKQSFSQENSKQYQNETKSHNNYLHSNLLSCSNTPIQYGSKIVQWNIKQYINKIDVTSNSSKQK